MYKILVCAVLVLPYVHSLPVEQENSTSYFAHPMDVHFTGGSTRIIGGEEVEAHAYPFQAVLLIYKGEAEYFCGGTLISNRLVLTAAHCVIMKPDYIVVGLGVHSLKEVGTGVLTLQTSDYVAHSGYNGDTFQNDIALIRLPQNVTFTEYIQPVQLANGINKYEGDKATLIGWGQTESVSLSLVLRGVNATIMTNDACGNVNPTYKEVIRPMHICTYGTGTVGVCSGDSGGPLLVDGVQVGITSFGTEICTLGMPSVFTRITEFQDWIARGAATTHDALHFTAVVLLALCFSYLFN
ncbi:brachyurin [Anoplophora glabripennis]|uniref:Chymotrypsin n=1 Tax=Anoplophora glabripennis TaxID=217634 RepID=V5FZI1_ANOGL|nr:brachyurin [Anoplophora glabripennis]